MSPLAGARTISPRHRDGLINGKAPQSVGGQSLNGEIGLEAPLRWLPERTIARMNSVRVDWLVVDQSPTGVPPQPTRQMKSGVQRLADRK